MSTERAPAAPLPTPAEVYEIARTLFDLPFHGEILASEFLSEKERRLLLDTAIMSFCPLGPNASPFYHDALVRFRASLPPAETVVVGS